MSKLSQPRLSNFASEPLHLSCPSDTISNLNIFIFDISSSIHHHMMHTGSFLQTRGDPIPVFIKSSTITFVYSPIPSTDTKYLLS